MLHFVLLGTSHPHQMQSTAYTYIPYDPSQTTPGTMYGSQTQQHPSMYAQGVVYVPAIHPVTGASQSVVSSEQDSSGREFQPIEAPMASEGDTSSRPSGAHERESETTSNRDNSGS